MSHYTEEEKDQVHELANPIVPSSGLSGRISSFNCETPTQDKENDSHISQPSKADS